MELSPRRICFHRFASNSDCLVEIQNWQKDSLLRKSVACLTSAQLMTTKENTICGAQFWTGSFVLKPRVLKQHLKINLKFYKLIWSSLLVTIIKYQAMISNCKREAKDKNRRLTWYHFYRLLTTTTITTTEKQDGVWLVGRRPGHVPGSSNPGRRGEVHFERRRIFDFLWWWWALFWSWQVAKFENWNCGDICVNIFIALEQWGGKI